jgi:hypothetical protein
MPSYDAPKGTEVSTIVGGEEMRVEFGAKTVEVLDEGLATQLDRLVADKANPLKHARKAKEE